MNSTLADIAQRFGTPCYVYFMEEIAARCKALRQAFAPRFKISYAVKANPNVGLLRRMRAHIDALDISSAGEMQHAADCRCLRHTARHSRAPRTAPHTARLRAQHGWQTVTIWH